MSHFVPCLHFAGFRIDDLTVQTRSDAEWRCHLAQGFAFRDLLRDFLDLRPHQKLIAKTTNVTIREIRLAVGCSQRTFAERLEIPLQTYRPFDSGRRPVPSAVTTRAAHLLETHRRDMELMTLDALSAEFSIHPQTLRAAARDGRLEVQLSTRTPSIVFWRRIEGLASSLRATV